ncbi:lipopolysaccharide assembly protein LapB [Marinibactrum halimedae]|uniref:Lipopolysaccharide assembly protein B n=1 Tax=Marinibactrum halimedae TaxID=1444977 RepID=A0AA37T753_9GAMM|nr:lipopolysaccharide assembly protein LapB [Marinibactrum halimedae]MCD9459828.1 lipopolysaccharide assembly protein LapB [Marinibactrum halimedae]GLS26979.1 lipopolysaccharide assembly protein B [Marinibactrum halimedae]
MNDTAIFFLIFLSLAIGYLLGRLSSFSWTEKLWPREKAKFDQAEYIRGLNHLLNENADAAADILVSALEVSSETLHTHMALGALLRKQGDIGRAISIHQNLLSRPSLSLTQQQYAQLELGLDYMKAGVLDRAENVFLELKSSQDLTLQRRALEYLCDIYRDEKEWLSAIEAVDHLLDKKIVEDITLWRKVQAHHYCELGGVMLMQNDFISAQKAFSEALNYNKNCARASLELSGVYVMEGSYKESIRHLKKVPDQDADYIPEVLPRLVECYAKHGSVRELIRYLIALHDRYPSSSVLLSVVELVKSMDGSAAASNFLAEKLQSRPSLRVVGKFLTFQKDNSQEEKNRPEKVTELLLRHLVELKPYYRCNSCGFAGNQLYWLCPSCKSWESIRAVRGIDGE